MNAQTIGILRRRYLFFQAADAVPRQFEKTNFFLGVLGVLGGSSFLLSRS
jgi:hypothetical protein